MGLCTDLNDVSSDSIPLLLLALFATWLRHLKSALLGLALRVRPPAEAPPNPTSPVGLVVLNLAHRVVAFDGHGVREDEDEADCVVCLCGLREGDQVRRLACCHVFHRTCLDGWLHHHNWSCPLCRAPLLCDDHVLDRRVHGELLPWLTPWPR